MKNNKPAFIREGGKISGIKGENHYLAFHEATKTWNIMQDEWFLNGKGGGFFANVSSGKYHWDFLLWVGKFMKYWQFVTLYPRN